MVYWSNLVVRYKAHPFFFDQPFRLKPETLDVSTQTMPLLPSDNDELANRQLITTVPWDTNAVDLPTDPDKLRNMIESIAIVDDASAHAYGKHDGTDISALLNLEPQIESECLSQESIPKVATTLQTLDCSSEALLPAVCCVENLGENSSPSTLSETELPEHLQVLFLQTVENKEQSQRAEGGLKQLLLDHQDTFAKSKMHIGFCNVVQHDIDTGDTRPIKQSPRRPPLNSGSAEDEIIDDMLSTGVIQHSDSAWASPICLVRKKRWKLSLLY